MSISYQTKTKAGITKRILSFLEENENLYLAIGKETAWDNSFGANINDTNPPIPPTSLTRIPELLLLKRVEFLLPALETTCIDPSVLACPEETSSYKLIDPSKITLTEGLYNINPTAVYIECTIQPSELPLDLEECRALGIYSNPTFIEGLPLGQITFLPNEIIDLGVLEWAVYSEPIPLIPINPTDPPVGLRVRTVIPFS